MSALWLGPVAMGLAGSGHCSAMCGGIAGSVAATSAGRRARLGVALHAGRLLAYAAAGAAAGSVGSLLGEIDLLREVLTPLRTVAGVLLVGLGVALAAGTRSFAWLDRLGAPLWRLLRPHAQRLSAPRTTLTALAFGALWGFLPCGLVYAALALAAVSGSPLRGATTMLAFGGGTLPALVFIGSVATRLRVVLGHAPARVAVGLVIALTGVVNVSVGWPDVWGGRALASTPACCRPHAAP